MTFNEWARGGGMYWGLSTDAIPETTKKSNKIHSISVLAVSSDGAFNPRR